MSLDSKLVKMIDEGTIAVTVDQLTKNITIYVVTDVLDSTDRAYYALQLPAGGDLTTLTEWITANEYVISEDGVMINTGTDEIQEAQFLIKADQV